MKCIKKKTQETGAILWGSEPVVWGSEPLVWGSEDNFANNGVRRSEMWGSWTPSPPTLVFQIQVQILIISGLFWSLGSRSDSSKTGSADSDPVKSGPDLQHCLSGRKV